MEINTILENIKNKNFNEVKPYINDAINYYFDNYTDYETLFDNYIYQKEIDLLMSHIDSNLFYYNNLILLLETQNLFIKNEELLNLNITLINANKDIIKFYNDINSMNKPVINEILPVIKKKETKYTLPHLRNKSNRNAFTLYCSNITNYCTDDDLHFLFSKFGKIKKLFLSKNKNFAFITYFTQENAQKALNILDGYKYDNLILNVNWAKN